MTTASSRIDLTVAEESAQRKAIVYDGDGDAHYDTISAFIKSMRASDPDAALYWLAKMLYAGEDLRFIARRIVIAASEDVGMADSNALRVAIAAQQAVEFIGMPEARIPLAHATVYIATAPKSNRAYVAIDKALEDVKNGRTLPVPKRLALHLQGLQDLRPRRRLPVSARLPRMVSSPSAACPEGEGTITTSPPRMDWKAASKSGSTITGSSGSRMQTLVPEASAIRHSIFIFGAGAGVLSCARRRLRAADCSSSSRRAALTLPCRMRSVESMR